MTASLSQSLATALVTGASAGIGRELALVFAEQGHDLVVVARTRSRLEELADEVTERFGRRVEVIDLDLAAEGSARRLYDETVARGLDVEILVNNAGAAALEPFVECDPATISAIVSLNVVAATELLRLFAGDMVARGRGRILNVASVAGFQPTPRMAVYGATKAYLLSLSEALAEELDGSGVSISVLCPGFTDTELVRHIGEDIGHPDFVPSFFMLDAAEVAREGYAACMSGEVVHINGRSYELMVQWLRLQPRWFVRKFTSFLSRQFTD